MPATRRRALTNAAAAVMAAAVTVLASVPFLPDAWMQGVSAYAPGTMLTLLALAAFLWAAGHSRRGRPHPRTARPVTGVQRHRVHALPTASRPGPGHEFPTGDHRENL